MTDLTKIKQDAVEAKALAEKATPGPFYVLPEKNRFFWVVLDKNADLQKDYEHVVVFENATNLDKENAELFAASRTIVPQLADHVLTLADEVEKLRAALEKCKAQRDEWALGIWDDEENQAKNDIIIMNEDQELERILKGENGKN